MLPIRDINPRGGPAPVTWALTGLTLAVFVVQLGVLGPGPAVTVMRGGAFVPGAFFADPGGTWATLITAAFLHVDVVHLVGNLFFLAVFGDNVEDRLGHGRFLAFYLLAAAASTLTHGVLASDPRIPMVGASGAISAVLGAYVLWYPRRRIAAFVVPLFLPWLVIRLLLRVPRFYLWWLPAWLYIGYWALIQVVEAGGTLGVETSGAGGVAWWAHVGGFVFGLVVAPLLAPERRRARAD